MTLPEVQRRLRLVIQEIDRLSRDPRLWLVAREIDRLVIQISRRPAVKKSPVRSRRMTPNIKAEIRRLADTQPDWSMQMIATAVGVNAGRVSETLAGKRT